MDPARRGLDSRKTALCSCASACRPVAGGAQEGFDCVECGCVEIAAPTRFGQHVPPRAQVVQAHPVLGQARLGFREDAVVEDHCRMRACIAPTARAEDVGLEAFCRPALGVAG